MFRAMVRELTIPTDVEQYFPGSQLQEQIKMINPIAYLIDADSGQRTPLLCAHGLRDPIPLLQLKRALLSIKKRSDVQDANVDWPISRT